MSVTWAGQSVTISTGSTGNPVGPASGDLAGSYPGPTVDGLQGRPLAATAPTTGQVIVWSGSQWEPGAAPVVSDATKVDTSTAVNAGTGLTGGGTLASSVTLSVDFGTGAGEACEGNDARLSDSRTPTGSAGGDLTGSYPNPTIASIGGLTLAGQVAGRVLRANGSGGVKASRTFDPSTTAVAFTEITTTSYNDYNAFQAGTGAGTIAAQANDPRVGISISDTGTTATGRAGLATATMFVWQIGTSALYFETALYLDDLSDNVNTFIIHAGLFDSLTAVGVNAIRFQYTDAAGTGAQWECVTRSANVETVTAVGSNVVLQQWYKLGISVDAAGTSVEFYLDGTLVATHTTDIPTGTGKRMGSGYNIRKTLGTAQRDLWCDYILTEQEVTR